MEYMELIYFLLLLSTPPGTCFQSFLLNDAHQISLFIFVPHIHFPLISIFLNFSCKIFQMGDVALISVVQTTLS